MAGPTNRAFVDGPHEAKAFRLCYLYNGPGAQADCVAAAARALRRAGVGRVRLLGLDALCRGDWAQSGARLLLVPGGRDLPLVSRLSSHAVERLQAFVAQGGAYVGLCAGAYLGSAHLCFARDTPLAIVGRRPLRLFCGAAVGPTHGRAAFAYHAPHAGRLVWLRCGAEEVLAYTNGGCALHASGLHGYRILARYGAEADHAPAAILSQVGRGRALLVGLHLEWNAEDLHRDLRRSPFAAELTRNRQQRERLLSGWLRMACGFA